MKVHVRIELSKVICRDTEDVTGADTLFVASHARTV